MVLGFSLSSDLRFEAKLGRGGYFFLESDDIIILIS